MGRKQWVDPSPEGWKYGFPRRYDPEKDGDKEAWLASFGYPVDQYYITRHWYEEEDGKEEGS